MKSIWIIGFLPRLAHAHGVGGAQIDLSLPYYMYVLGSVLAVVVSFLFVGVFLFAKEGHHAEKEQAYAIMRTDTELLAIARLAACILTFIATVGLIIAGLIGNSLTSENILPNFVWVIFAVGFTYACMLFGNIWSVIHPAIFLEELLYDKDRSIHSWKQEWGVWPAVCFYFLFRWIENILGHADDPRTLSLLIVGYLCVTFVGVLRFGSDTWFRKADPFGVFFGYLSFFSILTARDKTLFLRLPASGLLGKTDAKRSEIVFVMVMLSTIAFDGLKETQFLEALLHSARWTGLSPKMLYSLSMIGLTVFFTVAYSFFCILIELFSGRTKKAPIPFGVFAFSLLPIAVGYELAHYIGLLLTEGQHFIALLSDPLGWGWDLLGTADRVIDFRIINADLLWKIQVICIVLGHVIAIYVAHHSAALLYAQKKMALMSQLPMLFLMICYTIFSLWIIAQPT